jgi:hypothetical protein
MNGFVRIVLNGLTLEAEYVESYGEVAFSESWQVEDGQIMRLCWRSSSFVA